MESVEALVRTYVAAWNENDPVRRAALLDACWNANGVIRIGERRLDGRAEVDAAIASFRARCPHDVARLTGAIQTCGEWIRFAGEVVRPDGTSYSRITDFGEIGADGRLLRIVTFEEAAEDEGIAPPPGRWLATVSLVVRDYDEAIAFYVGKLGFELIEDTYVPDQDKRWVVVAPSGATASRLLLARAANPEQASRIGNQTGGRVFLFLHTDDFLRDYRLFQARGVEFVRPPREEPYGTVAVFRDLYGNLWDLIEPR
jgi:catechol 2,3-dioxygenase-like lactoylglutathione lyase family enzyme